MSMFIRVTNWDKIQGHKRKDVSSPTWFKFKSNFFTNPDFYDFTTKERMCWVYVLCLCGLSNRADICLSRHCVYFEVGLQNKSLIVFINKCVKLNLITILDGLDVTVSPPRQEEIRKNPIIQNALTNTVGHDAAT